MVDTHFPLLDHTVLRNSIRFYSTKSFTIPSEISVQYFSKYYLVYWRGAYLLTQIKSGTIQHNHTLYSVVYKRGLTRGKILATLEDQFAISFRKPNIDLDLPAIAIISESNRNCKS